jgi:hypothetical protein
MIHRFALPLAELTTGPLTKAQRCRCAAAALRMTTSGAVPHGWGRR